jgi:hypothetical protein
VGYPEGAQTYSVYKTWENRLSDHTQLMRGVRNAPGWHPDEFYPGKTGFTQPDSRVCNDKRVSHQNSPTFPTNNFITIKLLYKTLCIQLFIFI